MPTKELRDMFQELERAKSSTELRSAVAKLTQQIGFEKSVYPLTIRTPSRKPQQYTLSGHRAQERDLSYLTAFS